MSRPLKSLLYLYAKITNISSVMAIFTHIFYFTAVQKKCAIWVKHTVFPEVIAIILIIHQLLLHSWLQGMAPFKFTEGFLSDLIPVVVKTTWSILSDIFIYKQLHWAYKQEFKVCADFSHGSWRKERCNLWEAPEESRQGQKTWVCSCGTPGTVWSGWAARKSPPVALG